MWSGRKLALLTAAVVVMTGLGAGAVLAVQTKASGGQAAGKTQEIESTREAAGEKTDGKAFASVGVKTDGETGSGTGGKEDSMAGGAAGSKEDGTAGDAAGSKEDGTAGSAARSKEDGTAGGVAGSKEDGTAGDAAGSKEDSASGGMAGSKEGGTAGGTAESKEDSTEGSAAGSKADGTAGDGTADTAESKTDGAEDSAAEGDDGEPELTPEEKEREEKIDAYFDGAVFVGDSIMLGFRNYAMKRQDTFLSKFQFLAAGSYSANNALWELGNKDSVHPVYKGEPRYVWDSIAMMGGKKVFIMLGMNDLNVTGLDGSWEKYEELIGKIKESSPDAEIHLMSMTYILHGKEVGKLENDTIREYNGILRKMAEEKGLGYVNVADALADGNGDLAAEYCSDEFAHQNPEAYDIWVSVLRDYAKGELEEEEYARADQEGQTAGAAKAGGKEAQEKNVAVPMTQGKSAAGKTAGEKDADVKAVDGKPVGNATEDKDADGKTTEGNVDGQTMDGKDTVGKSETGKKDTGQIIEEQSPEEKAANRKNSAG